MRWKRGKPSPSPHQEVSAIADLVPHPLVVSFGKFLAGRPGFSALTAPASALEQADRTTQQADGDAAKADEDTENAKEKNDLAKAIADQANVPDLSLFAGFLGGPYTRDNVKWRLLYLDSRLSNWLLVPEDDIVVHERLDDEHAPSGKRDALWVRGSATVVQGSGSRSNQGRFLVGEFTRAGDFAASTTGGTFSAATGLLCEATTPGCCWGSRSR